MRRSVFCAEEAPESGRGDATNGHGGVSFSHGENRRPESELSPDGGGAFPWRARGGGVPTLGEVLERYPFTPLLVELKVVEAAEPVRRLLQEHGAEDRTIVASFLEGALQPFREAAIPTAASRGGITAVWLRTLVGLGAPRIPDRVYAVPDRYKDRLHVPTAVVCRAAPPGGD